MTPSELENELKNVQRLRTQPIKLLAQKLLDQGISEMDTIVLQRSLTHLPDSIKTELINAIRDINTGFLPRKDWAD